MDQRIAFKTQLPMLPNARPPRGPRTMYPNTTTRKHEFSRCFIANDLTEQLALRGLINLGYGQIGII